MTIQELLDAELLKEQNKERKASGKWTPSRFGKCYRMQFWKRKAEPETNPPGCRQLRLFKAGKLFHDFVQNVIIASSPQTIQKEVFIEKEDVVGYADLVGDDIVWDIKSQHSKAFWYMTRKNYDIKKDKFTNWLQVLSYVWMLDKKQGRLTFVSKDDLCINEYGEFLNDFWKGEIRKELTALRKFWEADELPPASPRAFNGKECHWGEDNFCPYYNKCFSGEVKNGNN